MTKDEELRLFAQLAGNPNFKVWLDEQKATAIKYLALGDKSFMLARAQGTYSFIDKMSELLAHARK